MACLSSKTVLSVVIEIWSLSSLGPAMKHLHRYQLYVKILCLKKPYPLHWSGFLVMHHRLWPWWWWGVSLVWHCCLAPSSYYLLVVSEPWANVNHNDSWGVWWQAVLMLNRYLWACGEVIYIHLVKITTLRPEAWASYQRWALKLELSGTLHWQPLVLLPCKGSWNIPEAKWKALARLGLIIVKSRASGSLIAMLPLKTRTSSPWDDVRRKFGVMTGSRYPRLPSRCPTLFLRLSQIVKPVFGNLKSTANSSSICMPFILLPRSTPS